MPSDDEQQIRALVSTWMSATQAGDSEKVLSLMTDDVVFLRPGHAPMRKADFALAAQAQAGGRAPRFEGHSEIEELTVAGDWAFAWASLHVTAHPPDGAPPVERAGHTLTVFHKQDGTWRLARDANLLAPVEARRG
ncbi:MAG TPA: SgcJ/EcaC family oxidoreductase [Rhizobacter sp.]|nr:SgcJ/EcaC family oxidoreductase [Rhizobacter sp.]